MKSRQGVARGHEASYASNSLKVDDYLDKSCFAHGRASGALLDLSCARRSLFSLARHRIRQVRHRLADDIVWA